MTTELSVQTSGLGAYTVVTLAGEIDVTNSPRLLTDLTTAISAAADTVIIDLSQVRFCDSSGLNGFVIAARVARDRQLGLCLVGLRDRVANVFRITRLDELLPIHKDLYSALNALSTVPGMTPVGSDRQVRGPAWEEGRP
jgi:anti-sigma B factor antagonist